MKAPMHRHRLTKAFHVLCITILLALAHFALWGSRHPLLLDTASQEPRTHFERGSALSDVAASPGPSPVSTQPRRARWRRVSAEEPSSVHFDGADLWPSTAGAEIQSDKPADVHRSWDEEHVHGEHRAENQRRRVDETRCRAHEAIADCMEDLACMVDHGNNSGSTLMADGGRLVVAPRAALRCTLNTHFPLDARDEARQLSCEPHLRPSPRPCSANLAGGDPPALRAFKCLTSWFFPKWYDWGGPVVRGSIHDSLRIKQFKGAFVIENGCMSPHGRLSGYNPSKIPSHSIVETHGEFESAGRSNFLVDIAALVEPPDHIVHNNVILVPVSGQAGNVARMLHRAVSANELLRRVIGEHALQLSAHDTLVVFVVHASHQREFSGVLRGKENGFVPLAGAIGSGRWAAVFPNSVPTVDVDWFYASFASAEVMAFRHAVASQPPPQVCFKRVVVWQNCFGPCSAHQTSPALPAKGRGEPALGHRDSLVREAGQRFRARVAGCLSVSLKKRRTARTVSSGLVVHFAYRTQTHRLINFNFYVQPLVDYMRANGAAAVQIHEVFSTSTNSLLRHLLDADVLVGVHGPHFSLSILLPQNSISLELTTESFSDVQDGRSWNSSVFGESFSSAGVASGVIAAPADGVVVRIAHQEDGRVYWDASPALFIDAWKRIRFQSLSLLPQGIASSNPATPQLQDHRVAMQLVTELHADRQADHLRALAMLYERPPHSLAEDLLTNLGCLHSALSAHRLLGSTPLILEIHMQERQVLVDEPLPPPIVRCAASPATTNGGLGGADGRGSSGWRMKQQSHNKTAAWRPTMWQRLAELYHHRSAWCMVLTQARFRTHRELASFAASMCSEQRWPLTSCIAVAYTHGRFGATLSRQRNTQKRATATRDRCRSAGVLFVTMERRIDGVPMSNHDD